MEEIYIFLNTEDIGKNKEFLMALWNSDIQGLYKQFSKGREIITLSLDEFVDNMQTPPDHNLDSTRLVIAQKSTLSKTGRLIRFLASNQKGFDAEYCCDSTPSNLLKVEKLFLRTYGSDVNSYPNQTKQPQ